ncbi:VWA domain-containing protein [Segnochrobactrum spirostomi]|uniref:VWA domain-containing protein n=1 Tax=Segnochrobactrum spirostomi TaxID=2608987 RepID=A0A6A7Y8F2_9HYPH|nr:VWA domain-containing protein [Segnochrobactrum spirostomi]MQT14985.1 VWA domain-containing protein [Segnochrobactrum spirostomi]
MNLADFHFLRPEWLLAILPGVALAVFAWRRIGSGPSNWRAVVDQHLLKHLVLADHSKARKWPVAVLAGGWILAALAMAGPTWERLPTPALDRLDPTVIVMSLAQSMNATDQSPSRLARARHKAEDILSRMRGGQVGLVVYADAPFVAAPLTEDGKVITQMMPELSTNLMPVFNDRPDLAIARATELLKNAEAPSGRIVLLTDGTGEKPELTLEAAKAAAKAGYSVNVIGVGTDAGATYLAFDGTPVQGADGKRLTTRLNEAGLKSLAAAGDGRFSVLTPGDGDLDTVLAASANPVAGGPLKDSGLKADDWRDMGPWLVLVLLALAPIAFRRGWIAVALIAVPLSSGLIAPAARAQDAQQENTAAPATPPSAEPASATGSAASAWRNLWKTPDQQAADAFTKGEYGVASQQFQDPAWQASALYKKGDYAKAASAFKAGPDPDYNRGNALAKAGELEDAVKAYDAALKVDPANADAKFNRDLVQKLIDQKKQEEQQKQQQDDQKQQSKSDDQKKNDQKNQQGGGQGQQQSGKGGGQKDKPSDQNEASGQGQDKSQSGQGGQSGQDQASQSPKSQGQDQKNGSQKPDQQDQASEKQGDQQAGAGQDKSQDQADASAKSDQGQQGNDQQGQQAQAGQDQQGQQDPQGQQNQPAKPDQGQAGGGSQAGQDQQGQQNASGGGSDNTAPQPPDPATAAAQAAQQQGDQAALKQALDQAIANRAKQGQPAQNGEPAKAAVATQQPMTEQDQNREQMLRMVPDDPTGLLRARIMSHYARMGFSG